MFNAHWNKESTDPRDHIYGIIGLTTARDDEKLQIDYSKSPSQLFSEVTEYIILRSRNLDVICALPKPKNFKLEYRLPSWVADWSAILSTLILRTCFSAASVTQASAQCDVNSGFLQVQGLCIDHVKVHRGADKMSARDDLKGGMETLCSWHELLRTEFKECQEKWDSFVCTLCYMEADEIRRAGEPTNGPANLLYLAETEALLWCCLKNCPKELVDEMLPCIPSSKLNLSGYVEKEMEVWNSYMANRGTEGIYNRSFLISESGNLDIGINTLEEGDLICILLGCQWPVILRPHGRQYLVLGNSYFEGYMYGRAIDEMEEGKFKLQDFELC